MFLKLFPRRPDHLLSDSKELKKVLADLLRAKPLNGVEEVCNWLASLRDAKDFGLAQYFEIVRQLDEAAQPHLLRLARDYLQSPGLPSQEEQRLWTTIHGYWRELGDTYARCVDRAQLDSKGKGVTPFKPSLPLAIARTQAARRLQAKWLAFRYGPLDEGLWQVLGQTHLAAEVAGNAQKTLQLYPVQRGLTSIGQQYLHAIAFFTSAMDSLLLQQIEIADRLIAHLLSRFTLVADCRPDSVYWVDAAAGSLPTRLVRPPNAGSPGLRFFAPGTALAAVEELITVVERGEVPADLNLGADYSPKALLLVLRHLRHQWAPLPPQRKHQRHAVQTRVSIVCGFEASYKVFSGSSPSSSDLGAGEDVWLVENVSLSGLSACVGHAQEGRVKLGGLLCLQPEGGDNWLLAVVRRFSRLPGERISLGIQILSRQAQSLQLRPRRSGFSGVLGEPGIWLREGGSPGLLRILLPPGGFNVREALEFSDAGQRRMITPAELEETGIDYEIGRFHDRAAAT